MSTLANPLRDAREVQLFVIEMNEGEDNFVPMRLGVRANDMLALDELFKLVIGDDGCRN